MKIIDGIATGIAFLGFVMLIMYPFIYVEIMAFVELVKILFGYVFHPKDAAYRPMVIATAISLAWCWVRFQAGSEFFRSRNSV